MSKKILVLRSANNIVVYRLLDSLLGKGDITCIIQDAVIETYQKKYKEVKFIPLNDTCFDYESFSKNVCNIPGYFDELYIPSSSNSFNNFDEVFKIVASIKHKKRIQYGRDGHIDIYDNRWFSRLWDELSVTIVWIYTKWVQTGYPNRYRKL